MPRGFKEDVYDVLTKLDDMRCGPYLRFRAKIIVKTICADERARYFYSSSVTRFISDTKTVFCIPDDPDRAIVSEDDIRRSIIRDVVEFINMQWHQRPKDFVVTADEIGDFLNDRSMNTLMFVTIAHGIEIYAARWWPDLELPF